MIDNAKWDEVDNKVKSLIYLSLGTEGTNIFHQRNPHTQKPIQMYSRRISNTTERNIQTNQKRNIRQIPVL